MAGCHLNTQYVFFLVLYSAHPLLKVVVLARPLMGVISVASVSRTPLKGTNTCYAFMVTVQERARRNSGLRNLLKDNRFMNLSSLGKWRVPEIVDAYAHNSAVM